MVRVRPSVAVEESEKRDSAECSQFAFNCGTNTGSETILSKWKRSSCGMTMVIVQLVSEAVTCT